MSSKFSYAIAWVLFAAGLPLTVTGETMTVADYLSVRPEATKTTESAATDNPFEDLSLELTSVAANTESPTIVLPPTPASPGHKPFVILSFANGQTRGEYAVECTPDSTVSSVLRQAILPQPIDFKTTKIAVRRLGQHINDDLTIEAEEQILRVEWDAENGQPTDKTNYSLQPNDRLIVTLPQSVAIEPQPPTPFPFDPNRPGFGFEVHVAKTDPPMSPEEMKALTPATVRFDVVVIEDVDNSFAEFDQLRSPAPFMLADKATMEGTLRVFEKHNLVRRIAEPQVMVVAGEQAEIAVGSESPDKDVPWQGFKAMMGARELGGGLAVDFGFKNTAGRKTNEVQTSLIVPHGQTVVMKTGSQLLQTSAGEDTASDKVEHAVYVVLTPEIVK